LPAAACNAEGAPLGRRRRAHFQREDIRRGREAAGIRACARQTRSRRRASRDQARSVEYANAKGKPQWSTPKPYKWDYTIFGKAGASPASPDETIEFTIVQHNGALDGFNQWLLNDRAFSMETMKPVYTVHEGHRYRFKFRNASDDIHPLHLHRHSFELIRVGGKPTAGVIKDVVMLGGFQEVEF
jgi:FtsP/CotA-like multicopper oxidase with cupredoxin domain